MFLYVNVQYNAPVLVVFPQCSIPLSCFFMFKNCWNLSSNYY